MITRSANIVPRSFNHETLTFEAVAATEALVDRGSVLEQLLMSGADMSHFQGAPVLDSHDQSSLERQLGNVTAWRIEGAQIVASVQLNDRGARYADEIATGRISGMSVGYKVTRWGRRRSPDDRPIQVAEAWLPIELSIVSLPADPGARVRTSRMDGDEIEQQIPQTATFPEALPSGWYWQPSVGTGGEVTYAAAEVPAEGTRSAQVLEIQRRQATTPLRATVVASHDEPAALNARMAEALFARASPAHELSEPARQYFGLSMSEIAREVLRRNGEQVTGYGAATLITRALETTSDYPAILGDAFNRTLRAAYQSAPAGVLTLARQTTARDFRARLRISLSEAPTLLPVGEHGEFQSGGLEEAVESFGMSTFGRILGITRQALINDDQGAFSENPARLGRAAQSFVADKIAALLQANPAMSDGLAVFHASHRNIGAGDALDVAPLSSARLAMRKQTGLGGELISVTPRYVVIPPELETKAETILASITPTKAEDVNPFSSLSLVVEPRLTSATRWYVAADPAAIDGMEYAYLEGAPGPQIETRAGFEVDGIQIKVRLDFGCGWIDHRGWWSSGA